MISVKNLKKSFDNNPILKGISCDFEKGKTSLIIGQTGSGKTVFLKCLLGLHKYEEGEIIFDNNNLESMNDLEKMTLKSNIGTVFQGSALFDSMNIEENVMFPLKMFKEMPFDEMQDRVNIVLKRVELLNSNKKMPSEASGGMQKRVAIARAICGNPKILLFDEPTSGLDPVTASLIDDLIKTAVKIVGATAITITHDMASVSRIADKVILIDNQTISWSGTPKQMLKSSNLKIKEFNKSSNPNLFF